MRGGAALRRVRAAFAPRCFWLSLRGDQLPALSAAVLPQKLDKPVAVDSDALSLAIQADAGKALVVHPALQRVQADAGDGCRLGGRQHVRYTILLSFHVGTLLVAGTKKPGCLMTTGSMTRNKDQFDNRREMCYTWGTCMPEWQREQSLSAEIT